MPSPVHTSLLLLVIYFTQIIQTGPTRISQHNLHFVNNQGHKKLSQRVPRSTCNRIQYYNETTASCMECNLCPSGYHASKACGYGTGGWAVCLKCQDGRFSQGGTQTFCKECLDCAGLKRQTAKQCGPQHDTKCGVCLQGYESLYSDFVEPAITPCSLLPTEGGWSEARKWKTVATVFIFLASLLLCLILTVYCGRKRKEKTPDPEVQGRQHPKPHQNGSGVVWVNSSEKDTVVNPKTPECGEHTMRIDAGGAPGMESEPLLEARPLRPRSWNTDVDGAAALHPPRADAAERRYAEAEERTDPQPDRLEGGGSPVVVRGNGESENSNSRRDESSGGRRSRGGRNGGANHDPGVGRRETPTGQGPPGSTRQQSSQIPNGHVTNINLDILNINNNSVTLPVNVTGLHAATNPSSTRPHGAGQPNNGPAQLTGVTGTPTGTTTDARQETGEADLPLPQEEDGRGD